MKSFSAVLVLATVAFAQTASDPNAYANGLVAALNGAGYVRCRVLLARRE